eukprot:3111337-Rhodomonas_salina.1
MVSEPGEHVLPSGHYSGRVGASTLHGVPQKGQGMLVGLHLSLQRRHQVCVSSARTDRPVGGVSIPARHR